ncbi:efflux RND transporter permease subunit [Roseibium album]|uniref:Multidrug transporter MdtB n=1 Tax=Roseibium album TaxID=311410 RepID=A0A0M6ZQE6_9HYPH|nr:efflux RND transporter permease subunit [Roseibium album]CTQ60794.1 Multidrug transporter MdtB [Roseibium album]CTQ64999.1 Multidrug transporter MdtB [Roseibium album]CTQ73120.1 Multidrug transporter MdtB [Roseibium album]
MREIRSRGFLELIVRHANAANLIMAVMVLFGAYGLAKLNTQFFPTVITDRISVSISWPGASAEDVAANILEVIEPELRFIDGLDEIVSYGREGAASVQMEFIEGTNMQQALSDVEQAVSGVTTLPLDAETPVVSASTFTDGVATIALRGPFSEQALKVFARQIRDDLLARGIDKVELYGYRSPEYLVEIPERELRRLDLTIADIAGRIAGNTIDLPAGNLDGAVERQIRALSEDRSPEAVGRIEVKSFASGEKTRVEDIGTVVRDFDSSENQGFSKGTRAIELQILRTEKTDTLKAAQIVDDYLDDISRQLPQTLEILKYDVRADAVKGRISLLVENGLTGLVLVVAILFLFLNARIALWVAAGIPVAMMATLGIMWLMGESINMISMFALIMMLGVIVDDAIVVGEHTATRQSMGDSPDDAAVNGATTMLAPIFAASLTTIAAFLPILLVSDVLGQIMGTLPVVVVAVVIASLIECFLVLPGHLSHALGSRPGWSWWRVVIVAGVPAFFLSALVAQPDISVPPYLDIVDDPLRSLRDTAGVFVFEMIVVSVCFVLALALETLLMALRRSKQRQEDPDRPSWFRRGFDTGFNWVRDYPFRAFVAVAVHWRYATLAVAIAAMVLAVGLVRGGRVGFTFFPSPEAENLTASIFFHAGIPETEAIAGIGRIEEALKDAEAGLTRDNGETLVQATYATLGRAGNNRGDNVANITVQLSRSEDRTVRTPDIVRAWREAIPSIPGTSRIAVAERRGGPPGRDLDIRLTGASLQDLKVAAEELQEELSAFPGTSAVEDDLPFGKPELLVELTPRGRALGFTVESAARQIRNAFEGNIARRFAEGDEEVAVRVKQVFGADGTAALRQLSVRTPAGEFVPLTEVVNLTDAQGFSVILRRDGGTVVSVVADVDSTITSNNQIIAELSAEFLPALTQKYGLEYSFAGRAEEQSNAFSDLLTGVMMAVAGIYIILAAIFGSYSRPIVVMSIIPFGIVGAIVGHYLMGFNLTILSMIGLLGLAGILVNNSIILVARFEERLSLGEAIDTAAIGSSCDRLRAVLLTSMTTIGGLLPLMFETSLQAQFLLPMAITIVFGLATATALVLVLVPALVMIGDDIGRIVFLSRRRQEHPGSGDGRNLTPAE